MRSVILESQRENVAGIIIHRQIAWRRVHRLIAILDYVIKQCPPCIEL